MTTTLSNPVSAFHNKVTVIKLTPHIFFTVAEKHG